MEIKSLLKNKFVFIFFVGISVLFLLIKVGKLSPVSAQPAASSCNSRTYRQTVCYNSRIWVCTRDEGDYFWARTNNSCTPPPPSATPTRYTPTPSWGPRATPFPNPSLPPGVRWYHAGVRAMRCSSPDQTYRVEFNYATRFISYVGDLYRSAFVTTLRYSSHPNVPVTTEYGYVTCACSEGSGMCPRDCSTGQIPAYCGPAGPGSGICVPCIWHDGTSNMWIDPYVCPRPASNYYQTPITVDYTMANPAHEDIVETREHNYCGSMQTDLFGGSLQTDMFGPRTVRMNGVQLNCVQESSLNNWSLVLTDRDCLTPTITPTITITPTRHITITASPTKTPTPTPPTYTPTPPTGECADFVMERYKDIKTNNCDGCDKVPGQCDLNNNEGPWNYTIRYSDGRVVNGSVAPGIPSSAVILDIPAGGYADVTVDDLNAVGGGWYRLSQDPVTKRIYPGQRGVFRQLACLSTNCGATCTQNENNDYFYLDTVNVCKNQTITPTRVITRPPITITKSVISPTPKADCCLYPIALHQSKVSNIAPNTLITDIWNGTGTGNFGWLTWDGENSQTTLRDNLSQCSLHHPYTNPNNTSDKTLNINDYVEGKTGDINSNDVRDLLDGLISSATTITIPVFDTVQGTGANLNYHTVNFAKVILTGYRLPGGPNGNTEGGSNPPSVNCTNCITARFMGFGQCGGSISQVTPPPPTVNKYYDLTVKTTRNGNRANVNVAWNANPDDMTSQLSGIYVYYTDKITNPPANVTTWKKVGKPQTPNKTGNGNLTQTNLTYKKQYLFKFCVIGKSNSRYCSNALKVNAGADQAKTFRFDLPAANVLGETTVVTGSIFDIILNLFR